MSISSYNLNKSSQVLTKKFHPFVKWAGGKSRLIPVIEKHIPKTFSRYFEPFLGGGALFFYINQSNRRNKNFSSYLSDTNPELINAYIIIKKYPHKLITLLREYEKKYYVNPKTFYYELRDRNNSDKIHCAARFIALNKTCYNGLYRVNKNGGFNVPFGRYIKPKICDENNLLNITCLLRNPNTIIQKKDFEEILLNNVKSNDFVYLDPPYNPINETSRFTNYTNSGFDIHQQKRLANIFHRLDNIGCKIIQSNSDTEIIRELYRDFSNNIVKIGSIRSINSKPQKRSGHTELIIKNFR